MKGKGIMQKGGVYGAIFVYVGGETLLFAQWQLQCSSGATRSTFSIRSDIRILLLPIVHTIISIFGNVAARWKTIMAIAFVFFSKYSKKRSNF